MKEERLLQSKVDLIMKTKTSLLNKDPVKLARDGELFMLTSTKRNQLRVNSTRSSDFTLRETSMLFLNYHHTDTLTSSTTEIWSLRQRTEEGLKSGISINNL
jgi:hypothetical protein